MPRGFNDTSVGVQALIDGSPTNTIWEEFQQTIDLMNSKREAIAALFTYPTTRISELVSQTALDVDFEQATEYGVPKGARSTAGVTRMGLNFGWYDVGTRYTFRALTEMDRGQIESVHQQILEADNRLVFKESVKPLLNNLNGYNDEGAPTYGFWSADGSVPPAYEGNIFDGTESHYLVSGATVVDSGDVEMLLDKLTRKGVGANDGTTFVLLCNPVEGKEIRKFRAGKVDNNSSVAGYDFIPSGLAPARLTVEHVEGQEPPDAFQGLPIIGSYGRALVFESYWWPAGYVSLIATAGANSIGNPVGFREHSTPSLQGLQLLPGSDPRYP